MAREKNFWKKRDSKKKEEKKPELTQEVIDSLDPSMVPLIKYLYEKDIPSFSCCSGNVDEHDVSKSCTDKGYIVFQVSPKTLELMSNLMDKGYIEIGMTSKPKHPYDYFGQLISEQKISISFKNKHGENLPKVSKEIIAAIEKKKSNPENLRLLQTIGKKLDAMDRETEVDITMMSTPKGRKSKISVRDRKMFKDQGIHFNEERFRDEIQERIKAGSKPEYGWIVVDGNPVPVMDLINQELRQNKGAYGESREAIRKYSTERMHRMFEHEKKQEETDIFETTSISIETLLQWAQDEVSEIKKPKDVEKPTID